MDKVYHFLLCFFTSLIFGWKIGVAVGLTVEATQVEAYWRRGKKLREYWWGDTILDSLFDGIGIVAGVFIRVKLGWTL